MIAEKVEGYGLAAQAPQSIPAELRALYRVHGGQEDVNMALSGFFGWDRLLLLDEIVKYYTMVSSTCVDSDLTGPRVDGEPPYWNYRLLPFTIWNYSDYLCIHSETGEVWRQCAYGGSGERWPSIEAALREVMEGVRIEARERPSWRSYLPSSACDVQEWSEVSGYLPTCLWYMLKARISADAFEILKAALSLAPDLKERYSAEQPWREHVGFEGDWWDVSQGNQGAWIAGSDDSAYRKAKYENGYLYFKAWQHLT